MVTRKHRKESTWWKLVARLAQETSIFNQEKLALPEVHHEKDANFDIRIDVPFFPPPKKTGDVQATQLFSEG